SAAHLPVDRYRIDRDQLGRKAETLRRWVIDAVEEALRSAWMAKAAGATTSSSNGSGNRKRRKRRQARIIKSSLAPFHHFPTAHGTESGANARVRSQARRTTASSGLP